MRYGNKHWQISNYSWKTEQYGAIYVLMPYDVVENTNKYQITMLKCVCNKLQKINLK